MKKFARFPLRGRPLFVYLGGSCINVQVGLGWAIVGGWLGGWLGALSYCQIVSCWIRVGLVLLSIEGRADVFFVGFSFSQSCGVAPSGVHFVTVGSRLKMDEFCFLQNSQGD